MPPEPSNLVATCRCAQKLLKESAAIAKTSRGGRVDTVPSRKELQCASVGRAQLLTTGWFRAIIVNFAEPLKIVQNATDRKPLFSFHLNSPQLLGLGFK